MSIIYSLKKWKSEAKGQAGSTWVELLLEQHIIEYLLYICPSRYTDYTAVAVTALMFISSSSDKRD